MNHTEIAALPEQARLRTWLALNVIGATLWLAAYLQLEPLADTLILLLGLDRATAWGEALHFFLYDTPKVLLQMPSTT
jgi:hypothetical protein